MKNFLFDNIETKISSVVKMPDLFLMISTNNREKFNLESVSKTLLRQETDTIIIDINDYKLFQPEYFKQIQF